MEIVTMNNKKASFSWIKKRFKSISQKVEGSRSTSNILAESSLSKPGLVMREWCANPESCSTDCNDYCKKLKL